MEVTEVFRILFLVGVGLFATSCDDDQGPEAVRLGVGAECTEDAQCTTEGARCLTQFRGGYCGLTPCESDLDCPSGAACVSHDDGANYCFLLCVNKPDCNVSRSLDNEANCTSSVVFVDAGGPKACVPPSGS